MDIELGFKIWIITILGFRIKDVINYAANFEKKRKGKVAN
jgi:hypothetical protein